MSPTGAADNHAIIVIVMVLALNGGRLSLLDSLAKVMAVLIVLTLGKGRTFVAPAIVLRSLHFQSLEVCGITATR